MDRLIFHVDVNSAFLSWEAARRVRRGEPDLRLIPSCIGGSPDSRRGIVLAKSIPAKYYNIKTGEPIGMALRKCPDLTIVPPDFQLYSSCSQAFKEICRSYAPVVEEFSVDECFLDFSHTELVYPHPIDLAYEIKDRIYSELGFTVNVGIGESKLCAKMASDFEKPDKVHTLFDCEIPAKMWGLPVRDLLFVGGSTARRLKEVNIRTIGELAQMDVNVLKKILGNKAAVQAHQYANGIDRSVVRAEPEAAKGYSNSVTLEYNVRDFASANAVLLALADSVSRHMRRDGAKAYNVSVSIRYLDFKTRSHQRQLHTPIDTTNAVYEISKQLLTELWKDRRPLRLMGIALTNVTKDKTAGVQLSLFGENRCLDDERDEKIDRTLDTLRGKYGSGIILRGTVMQNDLRISRKFSGEADAEK